MQQQSAKSDQTARLTEEIKNGIQFQSTLTILASAEKIYKFWRDQKNLPQFMSHLSSIIVRDDKTSNWSWSALKGQIGVTWESEIIQDIPGSLIAWKSLEGSTVAHVGDVTFKELSFGRGTDVCVTGTYQPPGGVVTNFIEKILNESPQQVVKRDLRRLKALMEVGFIATTEGQPRGGQNYTH